MGKVAEYPRSGEWSDDGYLSAIAAIAHRGAMLPSVARQHVRLARLSGLRAVAAACAAGEVSRAHAVQIASVSIEERVFLDGNLDADDGEIVCAAINAEAKRHRPGTASTSGRPRGGAPTR